ncbi:MAG: glycosyltransferase [Anaerolineae bacterium]|nr:glycosyltransferase [Anaerolineae bacterium]MCB0213764.1 glycosyltransferase [Anaerolineae bacterium]
MNPLFSVIIPTCHRNDLLAKCLDCLAPDIQTLPAAEYEVIVTDDGSKSTAEQLITENYPWVRWVAGPRTGPAANRNNGAKHAQGEWLVFTDDDCLPDPGWLEAYAEALGIFPTILVFEGRTYVNQPRRSLAEKSPINETGGYLWSCNLAIYKLLFETLDGFDERFPYAAMEDVELRVRLKKNNKRFVFIDRASVCHPWRLAGGKNKLEQHHQSTLIYLSIHPDELHKINYKYYLRLCLRGFLKVTLPWVIKLNFNGFRYALIEHLSFLRMGFALLRHKID